MPAAELSTMPPVNMSFWGLFTQADIVVQLVMILLVLGSLWCWTIILSKGKHLYQVNQKADHFEKAFWSGQPLSFLYDRLSSSPSGAKFDPMTAIFSAAMSEWQRAIGGGGRAVSFSVNEKAALQQRVERLMRVRLNREFTALERHVAFLGTLGSTAPFIGLFGTVWGIMNSFQGIAMAKSTNLAVVAPGIAEALFATALGLIAAIPAVVAYNKISANLNSYADRLETFIEEFSAILSRQLESELNTSRQEAS